MPEPFTFRCGWFLGPDNQCPELGVRAHFVSVYPPKLDAEPEPRALVLCEKHEGDGRGQQA